MMKVILFSLLVTLALTERVFLEHNTARQLPNGWKELSAPSPLTPLRLSIGLELPNKKELEALFWDVSNPVSPNYAKYLSLDQIATRFSAPKENIHTVLKWLASHGIKEASIPKTGDFVHVDMSVKQAETVFQVKFSTYVHPNYPKPIIRTLNAYSVPSNIADLVSFVTGMNKFPSQRMLYRHQSLKRDVSQGGVTPQVIYQTFNTNGISGTFPGNLQCVAQFLQQYYDPSDLQTFQSQNGLPNQPVSKVIGPNDPTNPGTEALLDIEYIMGVAPNVSTWFWSTGGEHEGQEPFVQWATDVNNSPQIPYVISVSYGDEESSISKDYADALNVQFQKMALRGVSVLFASGDNGVGCTSSCVNDPNWPASSPFITSVGGFQGPAPLDGDTISSGGFSNYYGIPSYQASAVQNYLANGPSIPPSNQFNATGRAMPDVSSFSENVMVIQDGFSEPVGGTSCAAPVFAAVISLVNDALLSKGKKSVGFLNQALYRFGAQTPSAFLDVTTGNNQNGCCNGFTATTGWDPITGWGGPNFPQLLQAFQALQN
eukprot:TRINITY_DN1404_c0_g1_i1.p1 TRINITY_DN1404_c0_g1~~TRINITY_DN1404_c0_g1_i1.p1  ORF type:complete len:544 (-),score=159.79 TRINITY_DN1404_c0_g1_i1:51-1682(-)